jgi:Tfp pilus assembly protein PilN
MRAVNLLPEHRRPGHRSADKRQGLSAKTVAAAAGGVLAVVCAAVAVVGVQARGVESDRSKTLTGLEEQISAAQAASAAAAQAKSQLQARFVAVTTASSTRVPWDRLLLDLSRVMPRNSWLSNLTASVPDMSATPAPAPAPGTPATAPTSFIITGFARSQSVVPLVLDRLALIPALSDIGLQRSQSVDVGKRRAVQFTIQANLSPGGGN